MPDVFINECFLYANDTKSVGLQQRQTELQIDINNAIKWSEENRLNFNFTNLNAFSLVYGKPKQNASSSYQTTEQ